MCPGADPMLLSPDSVADPMLLSPDSAASGEISLIFQPLCLSEASLGRKSPKRSHPGTILEQDNIWGFSSKNLALGTQENSIQYMWFYFF